MTTRLAVARLWFEGNRFAARLTDAQDFALREWRGGDEALAASRDCETELAAVVDFAAANPDWEVHALRCASASPGGPIRDEVFAAFTAELLDGLRALRPDAVYLSLHGAAITESEDAPELALLGSVRALLPDTPIVASFDLHANLNPEITRLLDFATGYRSHPHVDMRETAARALRALQRIVTTGLRPAGAIVTLGRVLPSFNMRTAVDPMRALLRMARDAEREGVRDVSLFGGFPYADTADTGASVMAWSDIDAQHAKAAARKLADAFALRAPEFEPSLLGPREAIERALAAPPGMVAVTDPADNPLSGGAADTPALFATLLAMRADRFSVLASLPAGSVVFAYFADRDAVAAAARAGVGAMLELRLGARGGDAFGAAVPVRARVLRTTDGCFVNTGPMERGTAVSVGRSVVLDIQGVHTILTESVGAANDPAFFALHAIDFAATRLLCVKAKNHFRGAFAAICAAIVDADCPGPAAADLASLPFRRAPISPASRPRS
ncbi:MAG: M81 family metallopeptidase [Burkholderiaceae bacterium]|nr:M81 family metallopeptidase [Burkholderiaceae bacterium]